MIAKRPAATAAVLALALSLLGCSKTQDAAATGAPSGPVAAVAPPAGKQWTDIVQATPEDGVRMGNPDAPIKLVEYASFTCPHCKHFEDEGADALQRTYISTGKVSWEFRPTLIHGPDAPITLLMNCRGPEPFFALARQLYLAQETWFSQASIDKLNADQARLQSLSTTDQFKAMVEDLGLSGFFAVRGLPRAQANACLTDQKAIDRLTATQERYSTQDNITGTPTFFVNGQLRSDLSTWETVDKALAQLTR